MLELHFAWRVQVRNRCGVLLALAVLVSACGGGGGGGGGGDQEPAFSLNTNSVAFSAASPSSGAPAVRTITGTVTGSPTGTLFIVIEQPPPSITNPIGNLSTVTVSGGSGQATLTPKAPDQLGAGAFTATITIRACLNDSTCATGQLRGSPQTLNITYAIGSSVRGDSVMPHAVPASESGTVVIRAQSLRSVTDVRFGTIPASAVTVVSETEVHADYPALPAGTYAVSLNSGALPFNGSIEAVAAATYATETLALPERPSLLSFLRYDAERRALLVGGFYFPSQSSSTNKLWRYTLNNGVWSAASIPIAGLRDAVLSSDGTQILALTNAGVVELTPDGLTILRTVAPPAEVTARGFVLSQIAVANDGQAIITSRSETISSIGPIYYYAISTGTFAPATPEIGGIPALAASADGSRVFLTQSAISPPQRILDYIASVGVLAATYPLGAQPVATGDSADRFIAYNSSAAAVLANDYLNQNGDVGSLGAIPAAQGQGIRKIIVNPAETRAFVLRSDNTLHSYALDQDPVNGQYPEVGAGITVTPPAPPGHVLQTAVTPDGRTLFFAGIDGVLIVPALP
jgi:hypothetical protein